jgi:MFS family permease
MSGTTALLQTPVGFAVDRYGARPFLVGGTLIMALSISAMAFAPGVWALWLLAILSGIGNSVIHPADYAILAGSIRQERMGRAFAMHTFTGNLGFACGTPHRRPAVAGDGLAGSAAAARPARRAGGGRHSAGKAVF